MDVSLTCHCGAKLRRWDIASYVGGYTLSQCDEPSCTKRHVWAATSVDVWVAVGYARRGAMCDVLMGPGKVLVVGDCEPFDELRELVRQAELGAAERRAAEVRRAGRVGLGLDQSDLDAAYLAAVADEEGRGG